ncbi:MAG: hypothetical protein JWN84_3376 [Nocardioides sp.]|nr:hypothetical protein [Nocardioides sp.]
MTDRVADDRTVVESTGAPPALRRVGSPSSSGVHCVEDELHLTRPVDELSEPVRRAVLQWLWAHDIAPDTLAVDHALRRDPTASALAWRERQPDGSVLRRWRYAVPHPDGAWPAPFPAELLDGAVGAD